MRIVKPRSLFVVVAIAAVFVASAASPSFSQAVTHDLVGHWTFDDGSGTDSSGVGNNATVNGALLAPGRVGAGALDFDGLDDYVDAGNIDVPGSTLSLSVWINPDEVANCGSLDCRIVSKATGTGTQDHYIMLSTIKKRGTKLRFRLKAGGTTDTLIAGSGAVANGQWTHIAATYDGSTMRLYQDGVEVGVIAKTGAIDINPAVPFWIGGNPPSPTIRPWDGKIDDVRLYSAALTPAEILTLAEQAPIPDTTPPVRSNGAPSGVLPSGTTQTTLLLDTDEAATCRYGTTPGTDYASLIDTFSTTGGTVHSTLVNGLSDGQAFTFYVRCEDAAAPANANPDDLPISFSVDVPVVDTTPPVRSNVAPVGLLPSGTTSTTLSLDTDEAATCRYGTVADTAYASLVDTFSSTGAMAHSTTVNGLIDGQALTFYVRCEDAAALPNANITDFSISFSIDIFVPDTTPPLRSNGAPLGLLPVGTTEATLSLETDEAAICRYGTVPGTDYASLVDTFSTTGGMAHSTLLSGLTDGQALALYVRCEDLTAPPTANPDDYLISFAIDVPPPDFVPPVRSNGAPTGVLLSGTTQTALSLNTDEAATCRYGTVAGTDYASLTDTFSTTGGTVHSTIIGGLADGQAFTFYVRCEDIAAPPTPNTDDFIISFSIADPSNGLVGHWKFDDGTGTDSSGNGNNGTVNGALLAPGIIAAALDFDGLDDHVDVGNLDVPGSALSLSVWINADNLANCGSLDCRIASKATGTGTQDHYIMLSTVNKRGVKLRFRLKAGGSTETLIAGTSAIANGQWIHVAATYDGTAMRLYEDGIQVGVLAKTGAIDVNPAVPFWIGGNPPSATVRPWDGKIDDVRLYDRALTSAEIEQLAAGIGNDAPVGIADDYSVDEDAVLIELAPGILLNDTDTEGDPLTAQIVTSTTNGNLALNPDGSFTYTPDPDFNGPDSFTYVAKDALQSSLPTTVDITVNPINDQPLASGQVLVVQRDTPTNLSLVASDVDGDTLTYPISVAPLHGTLSGTAPDLTYTPDPLYSGPDSFVYAAHDGLLASLDALVEIDVVAPNDPPVGVDDDYSVDEDTVLNVPAPGVLFNDTDPEFDPLTAQLIATTTNGVLVFNPDGSFTYTPDPDFNGQDSFTYMAEDALQSSVLTTVDITVDPINDQPLASGQVLVVQRDTPTNLTLVASDVDGDTLTYPISVAPLHGTLSGTAPDLTYTPDPLYSGPDSFIFTAHDGLIGSLDALVEIDVIAPNDPPVGVDDDYSVDEDTVLNLPAPGVLFNDTDPEFDPLTAQLIATTTNGVLVFNPDGSFLYTPNPNFNGPDSFTYIAKDALQSSLTTTVDITVDPINDRPVADPQSLATLTGNPLAITLTASDVENDLLSFVVTVDPIDGVISGSAPDLTYTPNLGFSGPDSFEFTASDATDTSLPATVSIGVSSDNTPPRIVTGEIAFSKQVIGSGVNETHAVVAADVTGDGLVDAAATNFVDDTVLWYENDGLGGFVTRTLDPDLRGAYPAHVADVDLDGDFDFLAAAYVSDRYAWYENDGVGGFTKHEIAAGAGSRGAHSIVTGDMDDDGDIDFLTSEQDDGTISWYENDGSENFTYHLIDPSALTAKRAEYADINGDGIMDVISAIYNDNTVAWYENDGSENFTKRIITTNATGAYHVSPADIDADGDIDVFAAVALDNKIAWYRNDGVAGFTELIIDDVNAAGARTVIAFDIDQDGDFDALTASADSDAIAWYENDGTGGFTRREVDFGSNGAYGVFAIDMDADSDIDVLSAARDANEISIHTQKKAHSESVEVGSTLLIDGTMLSTVDADDVAAGLTYTLLTVPTQGDLQLNGITLLIGETFTQADVDGGLLSYVHTSATTAIDDFEFEVADGGENGVGSAQGSFQLVPFQVGQPPNLNDGLVGFWTFDDGTGTDGSGNGNDGTVNGAVLVPGQIGAGALDFDGVDDYVEVSDIDVPGSELSLSVWINADNLANCSSSDCRIVAKATGTGTQDHYIMLSTISSGGVKLRFRLKAGGSTQTLIGSLSSVGTGQWIHVTATYDGTAMRLYQDGAEVGAIAKTGAINTNPLVPLWIGGTPPSGTTKPWDGKIDDTRLYNRVLSLTEIQILAEQPPTPDTTPPLRSNSGTIGVLPPGTTQTTISLDTNEPATCRYGTVPGTDFASLTGNFTTTGDMVHSTIVGGLVDGQSFSFFIRCEDAAAPPNANSDDFDISFPVALSVDSPAPIATLVGSHPLAVSQSTARGKQISTVFPWEENLYLGYGDWQANTGPIHIVHYDPITNQFVDEFTLNTESIQNYRDLNGDLYVTSVDPLGSADPDYATRTPGGGWSTHQPVGLLHSFDINTLTGTDLWLVGSTDPFGEVHRSTDGGATWTQELQLLPEGSFTRVYFAGVLNNKLYVESWQGADTASKVFDGTVWSDGPNLLDIGETGWRPVEFAGKMYYRTDQHPELPNNLRVFDGLTSHTAIHNIRDFAVDGSRLYVLSDDGTIHYTDDGNTYSTFSVAVDSTYRSIGVLNSFVYVGTSTGQLYQLEIDDPNTHKLTLTISGSGSASKSPSQLLYNTGEIVQLTATPDAGFIFGSWTGDLTGNTNPVDVTMTADKNITAVFVDDPNTHAVTLATSGSGTASKSPDQALYNDGEIVQLTATPDTGFIFDSWTGDLTGNTNPVDVTVTADRNITAVFVDDPNTHTLTITTTGSGTVAKLPDKAFYSTGEVVQLTATPSLDWDLGAWSGDLTGNTNPENVTITADTNIAASFVSLSTGDITFDIFYGDSQQFNNVGRPQVWVNVLGNASGPNGVSSLSFSLNGGSDVSMSIGQDGRRLDKTGDFNVEIDFDDLVVGTNEIVLTALNSAGGVSQKTVQVNYPGRNVWPTTYSVDWSTVTDIQDAVQVIDGEWAFDANGINNIGDFGYDRLFGIGDLDWTNYRIEFPVTVHGAMNNRQSGGLAMVMRWRGHTNTPQCSRNGGVVGQPHCGWKPFGYGVWYVWDEFGGVSHDFDGDTSLVDTSGLQLLNNVTYMFKLEVENLPDGTSIARKKVWDATLSEPVDWLVEGNNPRFDLADGSFLFVAHEIDVTVGNITVSPIAP